MEYTISRYEQTGESLFICLNAEHTYLEHHFLEDEKLDIVGTIERLVAELELKEEAYVAPLPRISKLEEARAFVFSPVKIQEKKAKIIKDKADKEAARLAEIEAREIEKEVLTLEEETASI